MDFHSIDPMGEDFIRFSSSVWVFCAPILMYDAAQNKFWCLLLLEFYRLVDYKLLRFVLQ